MLCDKKPGTEDQASDQQGRRKTVVAAGLVAHREKVSVLGWKCLE